MNRKFRYPGLHNREEIECLHNRGAIAVIADKIGAHTSTIYRELLNGYERDANGDLSMVQAATTAPLYGIRYETRRSWNWQSFY